MKIFGNIFLKKKKIWTDKKGKKRKNSKIKTKTLQRTKDRQEYKKLEKTKLVIPKTVKKRKDRKGMMAGRIYK